MPDIVFNNSVGAEVALPEHAITITNRSSDSVVFTVTQLWRIGQNLRMIAVDHLEAIGSSACDKNMDVAPLSVSGPYTSVCTDGFAVIGLVLYVGNEVGFNPEECDACAAPVDGATDMVRYYVEVRCQQANCTSENPTVAPKGCDFVEIDFSSNGAGGKLTTPYLYANEYSSYGMQINAYSSDGYTWGNMSRVLNTNYVDKLFDAGFGSPNESCPKKGPGSGTGGMATNCDGLGNVLIIQQNNSATPISNPSGGDIVFTFDSTIEEFVSITLFNALKGAVITTEHSDGTHIGTLISEMLQNEVREIKLNVKDVVKVTVHFQGVGAIAKIGICRDSSKTPAPISFAPPVETMEPTSVPTRTPQPSSLSAPTVSPAGPPGSTSFPTGCVDMPDIASLDTVGVQLPFPEGAIKVTGRNNGTIDFNVNQIWYANHSVRMLAVHYHDKSESTNCDKNLNVEPNATMAYSSVCNDGFAEIALILYVGNNVSFNAEECDACNGSPQASNGIVGYYIEINCEPVICESESPSAAPTPSPTIYCPEDVTLISRVGVSTYSAPPIRIISQDLTTVTFEVHNEWIEGGVAHLYTQYHEGRDTQCFDNHNVTRAETLTYTARCMEHVPDSIVEIWVSDPSFLELDDAVVPECCHPPLDGITNTVKYTFKLKCITQCPPPTVAPISRRLRRIFT